MNSIKPALLAVAALSLGACSNQYFERKDTINFSLGEAVATNSAVQIPDPWPRRSADTNIPMDPVKAQNAIDRYRKPEDAGQGGGIMSLLNGGPPGGAGYGPAPVASTSSR